jgi:hypothetical protein
MHVIAHLSDHPFALCIPSSPPRLGVHEKVTTVFFFVPDVQLLGNEDAGWLDALCLNVCLLEKFSPLARSAYRPHVPAAS